MIETKIMDANIVINIVLGSIAALSLLINFLQFRQNKKNQAESNECQKAELDFQEKKHRLEIAPDLSVFPLTIYSDKYFINISNKGKPCNIKEVKVLTDELSSETEIPFELKDKIPQSIILKNKGKFNPNTTIIELLIIYTDIMNNEYSAKIIGSQHKLSEIKDIKLIKQG